MAKIKVDLRERLKVAGCNCPVLKAATVETNDRAFVGRFERHMFSMDIHAVWCKYRQTNDRSLSKTD